jgi:hypothetical protein
MDEQSLATLLLSSEGLGSVMQLVGRDAAFVVNILDRVNFIRLSVSVIPNVYTRHWRLRALIRINERGAQSR